MEEAVLNAFKLYNAFIHSYYTTPYDFKNKGAGFDKLSEMYNTFHLRNLIKSETCYTKNHKSLIGLFFTNKPLSFKENSCHRNWVE